MMEDCVVKDMGLAEAGCKRIDWADRFMPVLSSIRDEFRDGKPLEGIRIVACLHVTVETANLIRTLGAGGADIALAGSNPRSTQDDVAAALADEDIQVYAFRGQNEEQYYECLENALKIGPNVILDDGADTIAAIHSKHTELLPDILGGCEETTTGVIRLRALADSGEIKFPIVAVNDAETKMMFDNRYGTGQSTVHGVMNATNFLFAGKTVVVAGYGWCGRGIAMRSRGLGANVVVVEAHPRKALEAVMDGYRVMPMSNAAEIGDLFITATGDTSAIRGEHFKLMKDKAILANSGHFNVEICIPDLEELAVDVREAKDEVVQYTLEDGRRLYLLSDGRLINLAAAYGHPPEVMDMSFANQALSVEYIVQNHSKLDNLVYSVPDDIDNRVARLKLQELEIEIESLTEEQEEYLHSWKLGT